MATAPGPWHYDGRRWIRDAAGIGVLRVQIGANPEAARLAAAAPKLLDALRWVLSAHGEQLHDAFAAANEAIAAAEPEKVPT